MADQRTSAWQNRIIGSGIEHPDQLLANPLNYRFHPKFQQDAMNAILDDVGWVQEVIVNQRSGRLIDGHLRVTLAMRRGELVPVKYVDLSENEERIILAALDPIAGMAKHNDDQLADLLDSISTENETIADLLDAIRTGDTLNPLDTNDASAGPVGDSDEHLGGLEYRIVIECVSESHQAELLTQFEQEGLVCRALIS